MSSFTWTIMLFFLSVYMRCPKSTTRVFFEHGKLTVVTQERALSKTCLPRTRFIHRLQRIQVLIRNVNIFLFSTGIIAPVLSACCFSFQAASSVMIFYHRGCHALCVCVCDTLSSWCSLTVFPVEQNKPLPQGFLVSKYRPQRIILKDCRVPKVVLQFTRVSL